MSALLKLAVIEAASEYEQVTAMRLQWAPREEDEADGGDNLFSPVQQHNISTTIDSTGVRFQRCGGGRRVIRKKIGE